MSVRGLSYAFAAGVFLVTTQRLAFPVGGGAVPFTAVVIPVSVILLLILRRISLSAGRLIVVLAALALGAMVVLATNTSLLSLALILALWISVVVSVVDPVSVQRRALEGIVVATAVAGMLGLIQSLVSAATGFFLDPLSLLPEQLLLTGYNSTDPIEYGGTWMKANGMLFLEPSFLSLMSMFSLVVAASGAVSSLWTRQRTVITLALLVIGFATAVAASGMVLLPALVLALLGRGVRTFALSILGASVALTALFMSPIGVPVSERVFTLDLGVGSNSARLIRPYTELLASWARDGQLGGYGAGAARDYTLGSFVSWQNEITTPTLVKLIYEYGILGIVAAALIVLLVLQGSQLPIAVRLAVLLAFLVPTDGITSGLLVGLVAVTSVARSQVNKRNRAPHRSKLKPSYVNAHRLEYPWRRG